MPLDVTKRSDRKNLVATCELLFGGIDILINKAGIAMRSVVEDACASEFLT